MATSFSPRGALDRATYELIGRAYQRVAEREPWLEDATIAAQIGLFQKPTGVTATTQSTSRTDEGATRMLTHLRQQFDVVQAGSNLQGYDLLILPDGIPIDENTREKTADLSETRRQSPRLGHFRCFRRLQGRPAARAGYCRPRPVALQGHVHAAGRRGGRFRRRARLLRRRPRGLRPHRARYPPAKGATAVARIVEPYFDRAWNHFSSHNQTPGDKLSKYAAAVTTERTAYVSFPVFNSFAEHGNLPYRPAGAQLATPADRTAGDGQRSPVTSKPPCSGRRAGGRTIVHVLAYQGERRTQSLDIIEDIVALANVEVSLKIAKPPSRAYLAPSMEELACSYVNGRAHVSIPLVPRARNGGLRVVVCVPASTFVVPALAGCGSPVRTRLAAQRRYNQTQPEGCTTN